MLHASSTRLGNARRQLKVFGCTTQLMWSKPPAHTHHPKVGPELLTTMKPACLQLMLYNPLLYNLQLGWMSSPCVMDSSASSPTHKNQITGFSDSVEALTTTGPWWQYSRLIQHVVSRITLPARSRHRHRNQTTRGLDDTTEPLSTTDHLSQFYNIILHLV